MVTFLFLLGRPLVLSFEGRPSARVTSFLQFPNQRFRTFEPRLS